MKDDSNRREWFASIVSSPRTNNVGYVAVSVE